MIERHGDRRQSTQYRCDYCGCFLETGEEWDHGGDWNSRPREEKLEAEIEALRKELEEAKRNAAAWSVTAQHEYRKQRQSAFEAGRAVKALEWEYDKELDTYHSKRTALKVNFNAYKSQEDGLWRAMVLGSNGGMIASGLNTEEEAKAACQKHQDTLVYSLLEHTSLIGVCL